MRGLPPYRMRALFRQRSKISTARSIWSSEWVAMIWKRNRARSRGTAGNSTRFAIKPLSSISREVSLAVSATLPRCGCRG